MTTAIPSDIRRAETASVLAWLRLMRVHTRIERVAVEHLRRWDLSLPQFDILTHVGSADGITQQDLAAARLTTKGNLSQLLDTMESCGLVERIRDGRLKRVHLTERGRQLLDRITPGHEALIAAQFAALDPVERDNLRGILRKLDRSLAKGLLSPGC